MQIDFYEEFPTKENLQKLKLVKHKIRLFVATKSVQEFKKLEKQIKKIKKNTEVAYWPIIPNSYWISPFSNTQDLLESFSEFESIKNPLLIDLELPILNKRLLLKNILSFFRNKQIIKKFMNKNKQRIVTAQSPSSSYYILIKMLGLDYDIKTEKSLMWYSSMNSKIMNQNIKKNLIKLKNKQNYSISLGTIATGILGNEPILTTENLEKDLEFVKKTNFKKAIIFRLGGLNKNYIKIIKKFQK